MGDRPERGHVERDQNGEQIKHHEVALVYGSVGQSSLHLPALSGATHANNMSKQLHAGRVSVDF